MGVCEADEVPADAVGRRVACGAERATVRYVGPVPPTEGIVRVTIYNQCIHPHPNVDHRTA